VGEVLMKHLTALPDVSMLAEPFRRVVARALEKDPSKRYASAAQMMAALPRPLGVKIESGLPGGAAGSPEAAGGACPLASTLPAPDPLVDEPILRAVRRLFRKARNHWRTRLNGPTRGVILVLLLLCALHGAFIPAAFLAIFLVFLYGCYWLVRAMVLTLTGSPPRCYLGLPQLPSQSPSVEPQGTPAPRVGEPPAAGASARPPIASRPALRRLRRGQSRVPRWAAEQPAEALVLKPFRERLAELLGSLLGGAVVSIIVCLLLAIFQTFGSEAALSAQDYAQYAWLAITSIAVAWTVLIASKIWEGSRGDTWRRRFVLMVLGLGLGLVAAAAAGLLMVDLAHHGFADLPVHEFTGRRPLGLHADSVVAETKYYLIAMAVLMALVRWWRQADPMRSARLSLWSVFVTGLAAALVADGVGFPQPWLVMVACAASVSVQLASPWIDPRRRGAENAK
jgi:hypothetical protein